MQLWPGRADLHRWSLVGQELQLLDDSWTKVFYQTNKKLQTLSILDLTFREASEMSRFFPPSGSAAALQQQSCFCVDVLRHEHHLTNDGATYVTYNQFTAWCEDEAWLFDFFTRMGESSHLPPPPCSTDLQDVFTPEHLQVRNCTHLERKHSVTFWTSPFFLTDSFMASRLQPAGHKEAASWKGRCRMSFLSQKSILLSEFFCLDPFLCFSGDI